MSTIMNANTGTTIMRTEKIQGGDMSITMKSSIREKMCTNITSILQTKARTTTTLTATLLNVKAMTMSLSSAQIFILEKRLIWTETRFGN